MIDGDIVAARRLSENGRRRAARDHTREAETIIDLSSRLMYQT